MLPGGVSVVPALLNTEIQIPRLFPVILTALVSRHVALKHDKRPQPFVITGNQFFPDEMIKITHGVFVTRAQIVGGRSGGKEISIDPARFREPCSGSSALLPRGCQVAPRSFLADV